MPGPTHDMIPVDPVSEQLRRSAYDQHVTVVVVAALSKAMADPQNRLRLNYRSLSEDQTPARHETVCEDRRRVPGERDKLASLRHAEGSNRLLSAV